jgi:hypothetical protein
LPTLAQTTEEMTMTTTKSLTETQISKLRTEAYQAGDYAMGAICDLAISGHFSADDYTAISSDDAARVAKMSRDDAYTAIVDAINDASAQG